MKIHSLMEIASTGHYSAGHHRALDQRDTKQKTRSKGNASFVWEAVSRNIGIPESRGGEIIARLRRLLEQQRGVR